MLPGFRDGALLGDAHPVFDLGEDLLNGIEVWRVGWQEPEPGSGSPDNLAQGCGFVAAQVVHDDDIAGSEGRNELLLDIGTETLAVDRSVEDARCCEPVATERTEEGQCAPVAVRSIAPQPFALGTPATQRGHVGFDPGLIDEDELGGIEMALPGAPPRPSSRHVLAGLFKREQRFF